MGCTNTTQIKPKSIKAKSEVTPDLFNDHIGADELGPNRYGFGFTPQE